MTAKYVSGLIIALASALSACATGSYDPPSSGATAQVILHRGQLGQRQNASLMIYNAQWAGRADVYGGMGYTYDKAKALLAGVPAHLEIEMVRNTATAVQQCAYRLRFVPQAGHTYEIAPSDGCTAVLTDQATGQSPADVTIEPVPADWRPAH
jgi:hypothetical protein